MGRKECERENKVQDRDRRQRELELKKEVQKKLLEVGQQLKYLVTATSTTQGRTKASAKSTWLWTYVSERDAWVHARVNKRNS